MSRTASAADILDLAQRATACLGQRDLGVGDALRNLVVRRLQLHLGVAGCGILGGLDGVMGATVRGIHLGSVAVLRRRRLVRAPFRRR